MSAMMKSNNKAALAGALPMQVLEPKLREDMRESINHAIRAGAVFPSRKTPLAIFQHAVSASLERHGGKLERLLTDCGDADSGSVQANGAEEYFKAVRFSISRAVADIQGALAELLALGPLAQLIHELKRERRIPDDTKIWVGDSVWALQKKGAALAKAGDFHFLVRSLARQPDTLVGVAEVKSGNNSEREIKAQIENHLLRAARGIVLRDRGGKTEGRSVRIVEKPIKVMVKASSWRLSRHFHFDTRGGNRFLVVEPPISENTILSTAIAPNQWKIVLQWSNESLANAAFDIFYWCLGYQGAQFYKTKPSPWPEMSNGQAAQNAVKMSLYYAIREIKDEETMNQAIKLYNVLGFGYALGANYRGPDRRIAMLWPQDLDEILLKGRTEKGFYIKGLRSLGDSA